jgi:16S rRNA (guanine527-N7)-methyltransferase
VSSSRFSSALDQGLERLPLSVDARARGRLAAHYTLLCKWAPKVNLTTVLEPEAAAALHYLDSLAFLLVAGDADPIVDVGTGAGFPGMVMAAVTDRPTVLLDPLRKRTSFLRAAVAELELGSVRVVQGRLERPFPRDGDPLGLFPTGGTVVSRATFPPEAWIDEGARVLTPGGRLVLSRGRGGPDVEALDARATEAGLVCAARTTIDLPGGHHRILDAWARPSPGSAR